MRNTAGSEALHLRVREPLLRCHRCWVHSHRHHERERRHSLSLLLRHGSHRGELLHERHLLRRIGVGCLRGGGGRCGWASVRMESLGVGRMSWVRH